MVGFSASWYLGTKLNNTGSFVVCKCKASTRIANLLCVERLLGLYLHKWHLNYTSGAVQIKSSFLKDASAPLVPLTEITSLC